MKKITESDSLYDGLENMSTKELLENINREDHKVPPAVKEVIPTIEKFVDLAAEKMSSGGRLFYLGAGTSGRLGILDASECPPTFGVEPGMVIGLIAGGDKAIRNAVEFAEDDPRQAWKDLGSHGITPLDLVVGIAASGTTPYVVGGLEDCRKNGVVTACVTCNPESPVTKNADHPIEVITGPEFVTGSTRMKAGTAQKLVLNMISTSVMIRLQRVKGNKMVDMQLSNAKLLERGQRMISEALRVDREKALTLLREYGSVRKVLEKYEKR